MRFSLSIVNLLQQPYPARPYEFGYKIRAKDGVDQYRKESSDGRRVTGSYGYWAPDGLYRHVHYVADENGYRASIRTSEPGTSNDNPAAVQINSDPVNNLLIPSGLEPVTAPLTKTYDSPTTFRVSSYPVDTTPSFPRMMPTVTPKTIETPEEIMNMILRQPQQTPPPPPPPSSKINYNRRPSKSYQHPPKSYQHSTKSYDPPPKSFEPSTNIYDPPTKNYNPPSTLGISSYPTDSTPIAQRPMSIMPQVGYDTNTDYDSTPTPTFAPTMSSPSASPPAIVYITGPPIPKQHGTKSPQPTPSVSPSVEPPPAPPSSKYLPQPTGVPMQSAYVAPISINLPLGNTNNHNSGINYNGHSIAKKRYCECRETEELSKRSDEEEPVTDKSEHGNNETTESPIK